MTATGNTTLELRKAYRASGFGLRMLAKRSAIPQPDLVSLLRGKAEARVEVLIAVAFHLGLRIALEPLPPTIRARGPVPTVVDIAIDALDASRPPQPGLT